MKRFLIDRRSFLKVGITLLASGATKVAQSESNREKSLKDKVDALLQSATEVGDIPGVVAMATNRSGVIYEGAFGQRALGQNATMTSDTVVWIASMTKALTSAAAVQLVEQGKLELDSPASHWVPDLANIQVLEGWDANDQPRTRAPKRPITLRQLLTHTSGFSYEFWNADIVRYQQVKGIPGIGTCQNAALRTPLVADPGERWEYGIGIDWAGKMIEAVSGKRLGAYLQENFFDPLGMKSTGFKITPDMRGRMARIHQRGKDDKFTVTDFEMPKSLSLKWEVGDSTQPPEITFDLYA